MALFYPLGLHYLENSEHVLYDTVYAQMFVLRVLGTIPEYAYAFVNVEAKHPVTIWSGSNAKLPRMLNRIKEDISHLDTKSALNWITVVKGNGEMDKCDYMRPGSPILFLNLGQTPCEIVITFAEDDVYTQQLDQGDFFELTARVLSESTYIFRPIGPRDQLLYIVFRDTTKE